MPHACYFSYHPSIAASEGGSLTTQEHKYPSPILIEFRHSSPPFCKNPTKTRGQECETLALTEGFSIYLIQMLKTVSISFNTLFGAVTFKFVVETVVHHYCMLEKSFV